MSQHYAPEAATSQHVWTGSQSGEAASSCWVCVAATTILMRTFSSTWFSSALLRNFAWGQLESFLDGNATSTIPHKYSSLQRDAFECSCADGAGLTSLRDSHIYEINTWLWNFGQWLPQPRVGGLSVAKTEKILRKFQSKASKRGWATKLARKWPSHHDASGICLVYHMSDTWYIPCISLVYPVRQ